MFAPHLPVLEIGLRVLLLGPIALLWVNALVRRIGLRTFSKMTAVDFVCTLATGSLLAACAKATSWSDYLQASLSILALLGLQALLTFLRRRSRRVMGVLENEPVVLMRRGVFDQARMDACRVTEADILAKLREANVLELSAAEAVILETTGDISVLHGGRPEAALLKDVRSGHGC
ncbi:DUF421 domain-containing protein [Haloferula sargassicola]